MTTEILGVIAIVVLLYALAYPLGKYIAGVYSGEKSWGDIFNPLDNLLYRIARVNPAQEMDWKQNMKALLLINSVWFVYGMILLLTHGHLPLNPDGIGSMEATQAFNTVCSFVSNTNLQHYSGETALSYLAQLMAICYFQFVSAAAGMAALAVMFKAFKTKQGTNLGNFWVYFVRSCTRILLPLSIISGTLLMMSGIPMTFKGAEKIVTLQGDTVSVARGPVAAIVSIKQLGTNGGGYFGPNSAHPFENPSYFTNIVETVSIALIPIAMVFALGFYLNKKRFAWVIISVMTIGFLILFIPTLQLEMAGNPAIAKLGIVQPLGSMEGKEVRFGSAASSLWAIMSTCTSNGSVNAMMDSLTPLSGMFAMLGMQLNAFWGGVGVGFINMFMFVVIAIFIAGLMVGRTPEFFGRKIEAREVKIAILVVLLHPLVILGCTALASWVMVATPGGNSTLKWLNNPGFHGFSEMLYEFTSSGANNGSGFEGLGDNTPFWNIACGLVMLVSRFIPIIGPIAIAGSLAAKKEIPPSAGTLKEDSFMFGVILFSVILIIGALLFFPALVLGPIAEYFTMVR